MPHRHIQIFHFLKNRELDELYLTVTIRSLSGAMIGVFIPVFLWELGYSFAAIFGFFTIVALTNTLLALPSAKFSSRFGFKHAILLSRFFFIGGLIFLITIDSITWPLAVPGILFGLSSIFFWIGYHVDFSQFSDRRSRAQEVGIVRIFSSLLNVLGPVIGGLLLYFFGFTVLFIIVAVMQIASVLPLFFSSDIHNPIRFSIKNIFKGQKFKDGLGLIGYGLERATYTVVWPLFLFTVIFISTEASGEAFTSLGFVSSLSLFFTFLFTFAIGKFADIRRRLVLKIGAISNAVVWIVRAFIFLPIHAFIIDSVGGITRTAANIPFEASAYDKANKSDIVKYIVFRETMINIGRTVLFLAMIFISVLEVSFFGGGALGSLLQILF